MRRLLLALLLTVPLLADVYWVKYDELADAVGTVNTYADPYGVQAAFDAAVAGDEIKIIQDVTNNYDSNTNSWTNRNADGSINTTNSGAISTPLVVSCWSDETTQVTTVGGCMLDFNTETGDGFYVNHSYMVWRNIGVTNAADNGLEIDAGGDYNVFYKVSSDTSGGDGFQISSGAIGVRYFYCHAYGNTATGFELGSRAVLYRSESNNNATGVKPIADSVTVVNNLIYSNTGMGINIGWSWGSFLANTVYANADDNMASTNGAFDWYVIMDNLLMGSTGGYGLDTVAGSLAVVVDGNNYYNNNTDHRRMDGIEVIDEDTTPDETVTTFVGATDLEVVSGGGQSFSFPRGTTDGAGKKGAVQSAAAAGATSYASAH